MKSSTVNNAKRYLVFCLPAILAAMFVFAGCAETELEPTYGETQDLADAAWIKGAKQPPTPKTLLALSRILVTQGRDDEAEFVLFQITKDNPDFAEAYVELSEIQMRHRRFGTAIKTLEEGLNHIPNDHIIINNIGMCHLVRQDYLGAEQQFRTAAGIEPNNTRYRANVALALGLQGRYEESLSIYRQILPELQAHENLALICDARNDLLRGAIERRIIKEIKAAEAAKALAQTQAKAQAQAQLQALDQADVQPLAKPIEPVEPVEPKAVELE